MKCLPASKLPEANGIAIHDWHAETLAIRAFNHFLLQECRRLARGDDSDFLRRRTDAELSSLLPPGQNQPFAWKDDITLHMYCSEAPCKSPPLPPRFSSTTGLTPPPRGRSSPALARQVSVEVQGW